MKTVVKHHRTWYPTNVNRLVRRLILGAAIGIGFYAVATVLLGAQQLGQTLARFAWWRLGPVLLLSCANYVLRFWRWNLYLRRAEIDVPRLRSAAVFVGGLAMSITPGKVGELLKAYLLCKSDGVPMAKTVAVVVAERFSDLIALVLLASAGFIVFRMGGVVLVVGIAVSTVVFFALRSKGLTNIAVGLLRRMPGVRSLGTGLGAFQQAIARLLHVRIVFASQILALGAWIAECWGTQLVVNGMPGQLASGRRMSLVMAMFIYSASTLGGLPTPGGLGLTDGGMATLFHFFLKMTTDQAAAATLLVRLATLWFAVLLGAIALWHVRRYLPTDNTVASSLPRNASLRGTPEP